MIKFSICMPVYNVQAYIRESIDSVLRQDYENWELIVVDDGATDQSGIICDEYAAADQRITVIHKDNQGLISARRAAIAKATGDYIVFLDSDDFLEDHCLSTLETCIREKKPDVVLYTFNRYTNGCRTLSEAAFPEGWVEKDLIYDSMVESGKINALWSKCIRTKLLQDDPTDYTAFYFSSYAEDKLQSLYPMTACQSVYMLPIALYNYRVNPQSITQVDITLVRVKKVINPAMWKQFRTYMGRWNREKDQDLEKYAVYFWKHFAMVFKEVFCTERDKKACLQYPWEQYWDEELWKYHGSRFISPKDRIVIRAACKHKSFILQVYRIFSLIKPTKKHTVMM